MRMPQDTTGILAIAQSDLTAPGLLALVVLFLMLGLIVPRWFYTQVAKERDYWRESAKSFETVADEAIKQVSVLTGAVDKLAECEDLRTTQRKRKNSRNEGPS